MVLLTCIYLYTYTEIPHTYTDLPPFLIHPFPIPHYSRYWIFGEASPGLFVEKGWSCKYSVTGEVKKEAEESESEDEGLGEDEKETTFPENGLNMWFVYDKIEDIEALHKVWDDGVPKNSNIWGLLRLIT